MHLPIVKSTNKYKRRTVLFGSLNRSANFTEGELYDCEGICHESFPSLTQKRKSILEFECNFPSAAGFFGKKCVASSEALYYDGKKVGELTPGKKSIAYVGYKVVVFPDKVYYNTKTGEFGSLENECSLENIKTTFTQNTLSVPETTYENVVIKESTYFKPDEKIFKYSDVSVENGSIVFSGPTLIKASQLEENDVFSETSGNSHYRIATEIKVEDNGKIYISSDKVSVKNRCKEIFSGFRSGDIVEISGSTIHNNNKSLKIIEVEENTITFGENAFTESVETSFVTIKRKIPNLSFICSYENRLWGCEENTIYASALGDPINFYKYDNLSTDSYAVESNTGGEFTAIAAYTNCCLFFKENKCYKLYGNRPSNFQLTEFHGAGILKEEKDSIVNMGGKIFYKGNGGIYAFYGGVPQRVSDKLGDIKITNCSAGSLMQYYYISGDTDNGRVEFVYDTEKDLWSKSGEKDVLGYYSYGETLFRLKPFGVEKLLNETDSESKWFIEFCPFNESYYKTKHYSRIYITVSLFENAYIKAEIKKDDGEWMTIATHYGKKKEYFSIPCVVKGCNEIRLRLSGKGKSVIESIVREFTVG